MLHYTVGNNQSCMKLIHITQANSIIGLLIKVLQTLLAKIK